MFFALWHADMSVNPPDCQHGWCAVVIAMSWGNLFLLSIDKERINRAALWEAQIQSNKILLYLIEQYKACNWKHLYIFYILRPPVSSLQFLFNHWFFPPLAFQTTADLQPFCLSLLSIRHMHATFSNTSNAKLMALALSPTLVLISGTTSPKTPTTLPLKTLHLKSALFNQSLFMITQWLWICIICQCVCVCVCVCLHVCVTCACVLCTCI